MELFAVTATRESIARRVRDQPLEEGFGRGALTTVEAGHERRQRLGACCEHAFGDPVPTPVRDTTIER